MNYYERYCGEYARDTAHLSLQEHGAYTLMLDYYYAAEKFLPPDHKALYRICRAMTGSEQASVRKVADEFFPISSDGLRHSKRADEVLTKAQKRIAAAKANGEKSRPNGGASGGASGCPEPNPVGHIGTASRPQTPEESNSKALSGKPDRPQAVAILNFLNAKTGRDYQPVAANLDLILARLKEFPADDLRAVVAKKCRDWKGDDKMEPYLRPATLFNRTKFAQYAGELQKAPHENVI